LKLAFAGIPVILTITSGRVVARDFFRGKEDALFSDGNGASWLAPKMSDAESPAWWAEVLRDFPGLIAACLGIYAVNAWKRDYLGKRRIELAEQILSQFYQARKAIEDVRMSISLSNEAAERTPPANETSFQKGLRDASYVSWKRLGYHSELFAKIYASRFECMVRFPAKVGPFDELNNILAKIRVGSRMLSQYAKFSRDEPSSESVHDGIESAYATIWDSYGEDDAINRRLDALIISVSEQPSRFHPRPRECLAPYSHRALVTPAELVEVVCLEVRQLALQTRKLRLALFGLR